MSNAPDYTAAEWTEIISAPYIAAAVVSAADHGRNGREAEDIELAAYRDYLGDPPGAMKNNRFLQDVLEATRAISQDAPDDLQAIFGFAINQNEAFDGYVDRVEEALKVVERITERDELRAYKNFILRGMEVVGMAYNESAMKLGSPISKKEGYYVRKIRRLMQI